MEAKKKKNLKISLLKIGGLTASIGLPAWAILEKFPVWKVENGTGKTLGIGAIMALIVAGVTFRKTILNYVKEKTGMKTAPPITMWAIIFVVLLALQAFSAFIPDLITICVAGIVGSGIGVGTTIAEKLMIEAEEAEDKEKTDE